MPQFRNPSSTRSIPGASIAVFKNNKVLLVQRVSGYFKGLWSLPGGHIELGESARDAALRELLEETGVEAQIKGNIGLLDVVTPETQSEISKHFVLSVFFGVWISETQAATPLNTKWLSPGKLSTVSLTPDLGELIQKAHSKLETLQE